MMKLEEKTQAALQKYNLIHQGDRIAVGVSGGADSVALLTFMCSIREQYHLELTVCHVNHGLRGAESDRDEQFVRELAERFGLRFVCSHPDVRALARERGVSVEEAGRHARYAFFAQNAGEKGLIATAHTLSDSMETVLLNLTRGTGLHGLCGIPRRRGNIIRPLLDCTRAETEDYIKRQGLTYINDSTNAEDIYSRNKLRHRVLPELEALNPALPEAMQRMMSQLTAQWEMTEAMADAAQQQLAASGGGLSRQGFWALPEPVGDRLLLRLLEQNDLPCSAGAVERMRRCAQTGGKLDLASRSWYFIAKDDTLLITHEEPRSGIDPIAVSLPTPENPAILALSDGRRMKLTLCCNLVGKRSENFNNYPLKNRLDCAKIESNLILRSRAPGDRLEMPGRHLHKTLNKLFAEAGIPPERRDHIIILADAIGPLWVEGFGADARAVAGESAGSHILTIDVLEDLKE